MPVTSIEPITGITAYGCARDEAALFDVLAPRFGVRAAVTDAALTEHSVDLAVGDRCVSVGHQTPVTNPVLRALGRAGVRYLSTRSIGTNHIDVAYADRVGIRVEGVTYSADSVADYTLMLMLMAVMVGIGVWRLQGIGDATDDMVKNALQKERDASRWHAAIKENGVRTFAVMRSDDAEFQKYFQTQIDAESKAHACLPSPVRRGVGHDGVRR